MINRDLWLKAVDDALGLAATGQEDGSLTTREFCELVNLGRTSGRARLQLLVEQGKATVSTATRRDTVGRVQQFRVYRLIDDHPAS